MRPVIRNGTLGWVESLEKNYPIFGHPHVPIGTIYFLPNGTQAERMQTGERFDLEPGYYINPQQPGSFPLANVVKP